MKETDFLIIGAGIMGLTIAKELSERYLVTGLDAKRAGNYVASGIRAQLLDKKKSLLVMDFVIEKGERSIHILNAVSPAFTCSFSFAKYIVDIISNDLND